MDPFTLCIPLDPYRLCDRSGSDPHGAGERWVLRPSGRYCACTAPLPRTCAAFR